MRGIRSLKSLDESLADNGALSGFAAALEAIRDAIGKSRVEILAVGEALEPAAECADGLARSIAAGERAGSVPFEPEVEIGGYATAPAREAWLTTSEVSFCARAFPTVPQAHPDAPALRVLGPYLRNTFLHRAIREQGGAYGAGAGYSADSGAFRLFSYRDPRIAGTFADFDTAVRRILGEPPDEAASGGGGSSGSSPISTGRARPRARRSGPTSAPATAVIPSSADATGGRSSE